MHDTSKKDHGILFKKFSITWVTKQRNVTSHCYRNNKIKIYDNNSTPVSPLYLFMADNIPLLAELKCGKINCEQHTLSETLHDRPGTTIPKPPNPRDNRNCYF